MPIKSAVASVHPKVAAYLFGNAISGLGIEMAHEYASFDPSTSATAYIITLVGFLVAWTVPSNLWKRYSDTYEYVSEDTPTAPPEPVDPEV